MRTTDFSREVANHCSQLAGGTQIFITGYTPCRQVAIFGNVADGGPTNRPFLYAAQAPITHETAEQEKLRLTTFDPGMGEVWWSARGNIGRIILDNRASSTRLVLPTSNFAARYTVDGASLTPAASMIPDLQPPQVMPPTLEALGQLLVDSIPPPPALRVVA